MMLSPTSSAAGRSFHEAAHALLAPYSHIGSLLHLADDQHDEVILYSTTGVLVLLLGLAGLVYQGSVLRAASAVCGAYALVRSVGTLAGNYPDEVGGARRFFAAGFEPDLAYYLYMLLAAALAAAGWHYQRHCLAAAEEAAEAAEEEEEEEQPSGSTSR